MLTKLLQSHALFRFVAILFFLHVCLVVHAQGSQDGEEKVTLNEKNIPLRDVFKSITRQTGLHFFYSPEVVNPYEKVTVNVKQQSVDNVLNTLLANKGLAWVYNDNAIAIRAREKEQPEKKRVSSSDTSSTVFNIRGKVTDGEGNPIPGATIIVKGTTNGSTTNSDGTFSIPTVKRGAVLLIRNIGYETREVKVTGKTILVSLPLYVQSLDETVILAYGTTTKRFNTGNISSIKAEEIAKQPVTNPLLALQGRVPGLFIEQATGLPGSGVKVRIQGQNSIGNGNDPLYVIDGVPYTSQLLPSINNSILGNSGNNNFGGNPFNFINPADIESIEILKDADATAIYGSRAANGAILITTKKGREGETKVNINLQNGWGHVARKLDLLNTQQYLEMRREGLKNDGRTISSTDYDLNGLWDTTANRDWQKELIGKTSKYTDVQVSASGGNSNTQFLIGAGYHRETTVFPVEFADRKGSIHFNINNVSKNKKFKIQLSANYLIDENKLPNTDLTNYAIRLAPVAPSLYNLDGSLNWAATSAGASTWNNPLSFTETEYENTTNNLVSNLMLGYKIIPGLELKSSFGYTNLQSNEISTTPLLAIPPDYRPFWRRSAVYGNNKITSFNIEPQISYNRTLNKGKLEILIGTTLHQRSSSSQHLLGSGHNSDLVLKDIKSATRISAINTLSSKYKYNALFGRINYNHQGKYILNLTGRRDGSSRFGPENQFHNFGAIGAAWIFSEEPILKILFPFISFGKLRTSYGTTGNDQINDYMFTSLYSPISAIGNPYQGISTLQPERHNNPYLQWEETKKLQFGMDFGFLKDKVLLYTTYFHNRSSNQLLYYLLPWFTGFPRVDGNFPATVQNSGWEFTLTTSNINTNNFKWTSNFNLTIPKTKLIAFSNLEESPYNSSLKIGLPINILNVYQFVGVNSETGHYQFKDHEKKLTSAPNYSLDRLSTVKLDPSFYGGFENAITYKGFELSFLLQFVKQIGNNYSFGGTRPGNFNGGLGNHPIEVQNHWQKPGDQTRFQIFSPATPEVTTAYDAAKNSTAAYTDASYIRLKNLSISWHLPATWTKKINSPSCKVYVQGQNLFTITKYKGLDPETKSSSSLPPLSILTMGINVSF